MKLDLTKKHCTQQAVWRQSGCMLAENLVGNWKFVVRANFSVPPPERQAAATLCAVFLCQVSFESTSLIIKFLFLLIKTGTIRNKRQIESTKPFPFSIKDIWTIFKIIAIISKIPDQFDILWLNNICKVILSFGSNVYSGEPPQIYLILILKGLFSSTCIFF